MQTDFRRQTLAQESAHGAMRIITLEEKDFDAALSFVLPYERFCVSLAEKLRQRSVPAFAARSDDGAWHGVFTFSKAGQLFHCLPLRRKDADAALASAFCAWFSTQRDHAFFSCNGEAHGTRLLLHALHQAQGRIPARVQRYDFMRAPAPAAHTAAGESTVVSVAPDTAVVGSDMSASRVTAAVPLSRLSIVRCTPLMAELLSPLQTAYEKEEVVFNLATYDENVSLLALKKALREQAVYAAFCGDALVAKGGTNARGVRYVQLGGIYTVPSERGKGYATALVRHIVAEAAAQQKRVALFVKPDNAPAQRLYAACGFQKYGTYETAYF